MKAVAALVCGALFGAGLVISDMLNPARVLAFLDVSGAWDRSLALVMASALIPSSLAYRWHLRRRTPLLDDRSHLPGSARINAPLLAGAGLFGVGWGLVGLCPGPAIVGLASGHWPFALFVLAMLGGMALHLLFHARNQ